MKGIILIVFFVLCSTVLFAQEVGIRFGGVNGGGGAAVDAVFGTGESRIHADVGFYSAFAADVLWDLVYQALPVEVDNFYWYLGPGVSTWIGEDFLLGACGEIGIEYRFDQVPIVIGADWRPTLWIIEETRFDVGNFGLNVRWNFGNNKLL
jgi:hypothetical protein